MELFQWIYKSIAARPFNSEELNDLESLCKHRNAELGLTGSLVHDGTRFLQILEGPYSALSSVSEKILKDERHTHVVTLVKEPINRREHPFWSMVFLRRSAAAFDKIDRQLAQQAAVSTVNTSQKVASRSAIISKSFAKDLWTLENDNFTLTADASIGNYTPQKLPSIRGLTNLFAFQPIIDVCGAEVSWVEALIRGPEGQSPAEIFAASDQIELYRLDADSKLDALRAFSNFSGKFGLTLNLLPGTLLAYPDIVSKLAALADDLKVDRDNIVIEITEQEAIDNPIDIRCIADNMKAEGFLLAIDDFGSGYAGLAILVELQPHIIKIDRNIIQNVAESGPREAIIESIIFCAERLGITVIAEGVETTTDLKWLLSAGVCHFQGFLFARPAFMALPPISEPKEWEGDVRFLIPPDG